MHCRICGLKIETEDEYLLETPNYEFYLCLECFIDIEDDINELIKKSAEKGRSM